MHFAVFIQYSWINTNFNFYSYYIDVYTTKPSLLTDMKYDYTFRPKYPLSSQITWWCLMLVNNDSLKLYILMWQL